MITEILAFLLDTLIGDPRTRFHPVVLIGNLIAFFERMLYRSNDSDGMKLAKGAVLVFCVLFISYGMAMALMQLSYRLPFSWADEVVGAIILSFTISPKSLSEAGRELYYLLEDKNLSEARRKVGWIVGRETKDMEPKDVSRATIETIAENTMDGIISPLFFCMIGGAPLAVLYRAANTMDSMIGYRNEKYLYFGRAAARFDDVMNYIPARITGILFCVAAFLLGYDYRFAFQMMLRDAGKHPSPNGGYAEAAMAGALHIRLGGYNVYFGQKHFRAYMGDPLQEIDERHIMASIRMMYTAVILFLGIGYGIFWNY